MGTPGTGPGKRFVPWSDWECACWAATILSAIMRVIDRGEGKTHGSRWVALRGGERCPLWVAPAVSLPGIAGSSGMVVVPQWDVPHLATMRGLQPLPLLSAIVPLPH